MAERYKCLSFTLEMPFKDTQDCEDSVHGWNPVRPQPRLCAQGLCTQHRFGVQVSRLGVD